MIESSVVVEVRTNGGLSEILLAPTDAGVEEALRRLDGSSVSLATIRHGDDELFIGGGPECVTMTILRSDGDSMALVGMPGVEGEVQMVVGGQRINQPANLLVDLLTAARVAAWFLQNGEEAPDVRWERHG